MKRVLVLALFALASLPANARECGEGRVKGGLSVDGDALANYECATLARIYCRIAEDRDAGMAQEEAAKRSADWLNQLNRTGSNTRANWTPILAIAAGDVYRNKDRKPGPTYYRAAYACGVARRIGTDAEAQRRVGKAFDAAADRCEKQHALEGPRSYPNEPLRNCLAESVKKLAPPVAR